MVMMIGILTTVPCTVAMVLLLHDIDGGGSVGGVTTPMNHIERVPLIKY